MRCLELRAMDDVQRQCPREAATTPRDLPQLRRLYRALPIHWPRPRNFMVLYSDNPPNHTDYRFQQTSLTILLLRRLHVFHNPIRIVITRASLPASAMFKAQVLRRNFSLFNRVPYSRIVRSAARDGHESVIIQRVRIHEPFFSKS